jgi:hypothetical protein
MKSEIAKILMSHQRMPAGILIEDATFFTNLLH